MNERVLVVDDDEDIRATLELLLSEAGYEVETATNGQEALQHMVAEPPDVVVLDLMMPVMHGWELLDVLHAHPGFGHVPMVVTSAGDHPPPDADVVLRKPYDVEVLLDAIARLVHRSPSPEQPSAP